MNRECLANAVLVSLPMNFVEAILSVRSALDDDVTSALQKILAGARGANGHTLDLPSPRTGVLYQGKYGAELLGVGFTVDTLADVFGRVVDMLADVAPEVLVSLSEVRTRGRRLVALDQRHIHPRSPHLPVLRTTSGWWISKNISKEQLKLALRMTCEVSGLTFGKDIKFPIR
jgi:hypothetical protein